MKESHNRAVIYTRVSTQEQHPENQLPALREWASRLNLDVIEVYQETESAWKAGHQKELARLVDNAARRRFDVILVWALDRLSREGALAILSLVSRLNKSGVRVYSWGETWTLAPGELGELLYAVTGWVARMESQRRSERTKAGLERAKKEGKKLGRPRNDS